MGGADCELLGDGWLAQPVNAWSSLAYVVAAAWVLVRRRDAVGALGVAALVLTGVGSFAYHGPQPHWGDAVHDASILALVAAVFAAITVEGRVRTGLWGPPPVVDGTALVALGLGAALYVLGRTGGALCSPSSVVQLHAAWHVATAVAAGTVLGRPPRAQPPLS